MQALSPGAGSEERPEGPTGVAGPSRRSAGGAALFWFFVRANASSWVVRGAAVLSALTVLAWAARGGGDSSGLTAKGAALLLTAASNTLVWGAEIVAALGCTVGALSRSEREGVAWLLAMRGATRGSALRARLLASVLVAWVLQAAPVVLFFCVFWRREASSGRVEMVRALASALGHGALFAAMVVPLFLATMGRGRRGGFAMAAALLFVPELLRFRTGEAGSWERVLSVQGTALAVGRGLTEPWVDMTLLVQGLAVAALLVAACWAALLRSEPQQVRPLS